MMVDRKCKCCKKDFQARSADVARGWGLFAQRVVRQKFKKKRMGSTKHI
jgi:hypothetical protein